MRFPPLSPPQGAQICAGPKAPRLSQQIWKLCTLPSSSTAPLSPTKILSNSRVSSLQLIVCLWALFLGPVCMFLMCALSCACVCGRVRTCNHAHYCTIIMAGKASYRALYLVAADLLGKGERNHEDIQGVRASSRGAREGEHCIFDPVQCAG